MSPHDTLQGAGDSTLFSVKIQRSPKNIAKKTVNRGASMDYQDYISSSIRSNHRPMVSTALNPLQPKQAMIHQLPMQDYQLEKWRNAYRSSQSASRHFYTGSSFIIHNQ